MNIRGSLVAIVTPMNEDFSVDYFSLERLVNFHLENGTASIVAAGTTGESSTLSVEEHIDVARFVVKSVDGKVPVGVGTGANSTAEAIELHSRARDIGADYALSVVPYYNRPTQIGLFKHYEKIHDALDFPMILYNVPGRTVADLENETALELAKLPNVVGIKDATGNLYRNQELIKKSPEGFSIYSGDDPTALPFMLCGGDGVVSVTANIQPAMMSRMCALASKGDVEGARRVNEKLLDLHHSLFIEPNPVPVKYCLAKMGLIKNVVRLPLSPLDSRYAPILDVALELSSAAAP